MKYLLQTFIIFPVGTTFVCKNKFHIKMSLLGIYLNKSQLIKQNINLNTLNKNNSSWNISC